MKNINKGRGEALPSPLTPIMDTTNIKYSTDLLSLARKDTELKRVSSSGGDEYAGACPFCGGKDRFRVQPNRPDGAKWYCRGCGNEKWHDVIDYVIYRDRVDFQEALRRLQGENIPQHERSSIKAPTIDRKRWTATARRFATRCAKLLYKEDAKAALAYLHKRGLIDDTLLGWQIGYNPDDDNGDPLVWGLTEKDSIYLPRGIVIPCFSEETLHYIKVRRSKDAQVKYMLLRGSQPFLYGAQTFKRSTMAFLFESELDVLLAYQAGPVLGYGSIPAGQRLHSTYQKYFDSIEDCIIAFDNDPPGQNAADDLCSRSTHFYKAAPLPTGKDLTEYYQTTGNPDTILEWLLNQLDLIGGKNETR